MPAIVRKGLDKHIGHASPTPNPFHKTSYATGSSNVFVNGAAAVRKGDVTACGDPATGASPNVYVNGIQVHRKGDEIAREHHRIKVSRGCRIKGTLLSLILP